MISAAEPLTPPDCDLRDFAFMPLDVRRMLTSETWVLGTHEERCAALALWCEAWHQQPAGSLPDNDRMLAHLSGAGARWKAVRDHALRGWVKCSDGRLYHPVVAEKANEAWEKKERQRERGKRGNAIRWGSRKDAADDPARIAQGSPEDRQRIAEGSREESLKDRKGQGQGQGQGQGEEKEPLTPSPDGDGEQEFSGNGEGQKPPGWHGQWRGLRANGTNPRAIAAAAEAAKPPPPEPTTALWPLLKARGMTAAEFRGWTKRCAIDDSARRVEAPAFVAATLKREHGHAIEADGWRIEERT